MGLEWSFPFGPNRIHRHSFFPQTGGDNECPALSPPLLNSLWRAACSRLRLLSWLPPPPPRRCALAPPGPCHRTALLPRRPPRPSTYCSTPFRYTGSARSQGVRRNARVSCHRRRRPWPSKSSCGRECVAPSTWLVVLRSISTPVLHASAYHLLWYFYLRYKQL